MLKARLKNRILRIADEKADEYKKLGYTITDMEGNLIFAPEDKDREIAELKRKVAGLEARLAEYEKQTAETSAAKVKKKN